MNIAEAMQALLDGKKMRDRSWEKGEYIYLKDKLLYSHNNLECNLKVDDCYSEWEIYEKTKTETKFKVGDRVRIQSHRIEIFKKHYDVGINEGIVKEIHCCPDLKPELGGVAVKFIGELDIIHIHESDLEKVEEEPRPVNFCICEFCKKSLRDRLPGEPFKTKVNTLPGHTVCSDECEKKLKERLEKNSSNPETKKELKLEVGKSYKNRFGEIVKIINCNYLENNPYGGDDGRAYRPSGGYYSLGTAGSSNFDLIEEVETKPEPKFKVGDRVKHTSHKDISGEVISVWYDDLYEVQTYRIKRSESHSILVQENVLEKVKEEKSEICSKCGHEVGTIAFYNEPDTANRFCSFECMGEEKDEEEFDIDKEFEDISVEEFYKLAEKTAIYHVLDYLRTNTTKRDARLLKLNILRILNRLPPGYMYKEKDEWTYPCVVQSKKNSSVLFIALLDDPDDKNKFFFQVSEGWSIPEAVNKKDFRVIATELRNLE